MSHRLISFALALTTILGTGISLGAADLSRSAIVVCTVEKTGNPWTLVAHGELISSRSGNRTEYKLEVAGHTFSYTVDSNPDGSNTLSFPGSLSLVRTLVEKSHGQLTTPRGPVVIPSSPHSLSVDYDGNIREHAISPTLDRVVLLITAAGSGCPRTGEGMRPNPTAVRDARKSGARPSP